VPVYPELRGHLAGLFSPVEMNSPLGAVRRDVIYPRKKFLIKNPIFAGRSAKRLIKYGNQSFPYGM